MNAFIKQLMLLMLIIVAFVVSGCIPFLHGGHGGGHKGRLVENQSLVSQENNNGLIVQQVNNREPTE